MQKFPLRSQINRQADDGDHKRAIKRSTTASAHEIPPQMTQKVCQRIAAGVVTHQLSSTTMHPSTSSVRICFRTPSKDSENAVTWDEILSVGCRSKSLPSPVSSSMMVDSTSVPPAVIAATTQEPVQQTSAGILEVHCNGTASSKTNNTTTTTSNSNANRNKNKGSDDNAGGHSQQQQSIALAAGAVPPTMPAASAREFMTFERLRLGDQINFLLFDPYRTLKFLITELKSRLRTVVPDDINVQKILAEIQQTMKRIRIPNATEPLPFQARPTIVARGVAAVMEKPVECILPKERCHVIKGGPLINHAKRVNSFCQTMEPQLANVSVCQMCEHQVKQGAAGCNQKRMNGNSDAEGDVLAEVDVTGSCQRSGDHREGIEVKKHFSCKSLQDAIENLKIKSNPFMDSDDTQKIITHLETELSNFQRELQRTSSSSSSLRVQPTRKNLKVQCKRQLNEDTEEMEAEKEIQKKPSQDEETFPDFIAQLQRTSSATHGKTLDFSNQASATTISKESQTNLKDPTQMFCHLEKEKLLLLQQFRASEMQNIQADLNELHVLIKDQLDSIYQSVTQDNLNLKYHHSREKGTQQNKKNQKRQKNWFAEKTPVTGRLPSSSSSLTVLTSSVLSLTKVGVSSQGSTDSLEMQKKPSKQPPTTTDSRNANNTKLMMKQKSSSSSLSTVADAKKHHDISDIDKANKAVGGGDNGRKKSKNQHNLFIHPDEDDDKCADAGLFAETPHCNGKKCHSPAVECEGCSHCCCPHTGMDRTVHGIMTTDADRTATHCNIKSTKKTSPAAMACHKHRQQCHQQPSTRTTPTVQLISSSLAVPLERPSSCTVMQSAADEAAPKLDAVTNAAIRTIMENAYAASTAIAAEHSNGIRMRAHCQSLPAHNSWQRVNLKNPTGCQLKKQICGDRYERTIMNNSKNNNDDDNRSNGSDEIHQDCQKCRSRSINPFGGLHSDEMHEAGADNAAATTAAVSFSCRRRCALSAHDRDDGGAGGDGPIYWDKGSRPAIRGDFTCHRRQPKQTRELVPSTAPKAAFQMDFGEFKQFLDEVTDLTPRLEKTFK